MTTSTGSERAVWATDLLALYRREYEPMVRLAFLLTGSNETAEEVVQDAFVKVQSRWDTIRTPGAYLRQVVVNGCRSRHRKRRFELRVEEPPETSEEGIEVDGLAHSIERLTPRRRAAIVLRYYADLPDDEIAAVLRCRRATVRSLIHRGLAQLRETIET